MIEIKTKSGSHVAFAESAIVSYEWDKSENVIKIWLTNGLHYFVEQSGLPLPVFNLRVIRLHELANKNQTN
jgi:hypothetical protein